MYKLVRVIKSLCFSVLFVSLLASAFAEAPIYFLCGPDEDGCDDEYAQYCFCIPYNVRHATKPYCLDFVNFTCTPLVDVPDCNPRDIFPDQGSCLATIFQSEPEPPCRIVTQPYCESHQSAMCPENGHRTGCI
jgi:hypothetical protein